MFNRTNVMLEIINKQAVSIDRLASENERLRDMYNASQNTIDALVKQLEEINQAKENISHNSINRCPECSGELEWTYVINEDAKTGEDPRIYSVICTNCEYEDYD